jgi:hypothetical protein
MWISAINNMSLLTIFSAPKPFTNPHIATIQANAIQSWVHLYPEVDVILIGEETGLAEAAARPGVRHLPDVARNKEGTPLVSSIFRLARENSISPLLAYVNADIILMSDFLEAARQVSAQVGKFLIIGQRWDLDIPAPLDFAAGWEIRLHEQIKSQGELYPPFGSDYFIIPRTCFTDIPDFAIGRAAWDNWMIYKSRREHWATIDATSSIQDIHQKHDYSHLPGGKPHYHLPESDENLRLAGGQMRKNFRLIDCDRRLVGNRMTGPIWTPRKILREVEILPLVTWRSERLARVFFYLFHPVQAWKYVLGKISRVVGKPSGIEPKG